MFSGIVSEVGRVAAISRRGGAARFVVDAPKIAPQLETGVSVAVNGVCQTVTSAGDGRFGFDSVGETLRRTNLRSLAVGSAVNLEVALRLGDRVSGHLVSGHVDGTCIVRQRRSLGSAGHDFAVEVPADLSKYVYERGSVCLDGVSLTVKTVRGTMVEVAVIPFTWENTIIRNWRVGSVINIEVDQIAKYLTPRQQERGAKA